MNRSVTNSSRINTKLIAMLAIMAILLAVSSIYFFLQSRDNQSSTVGINASQLEERNKEDSARVLGQLGDILEFEEADPTVARIEDPAVLKESNPEFYAKAQSGDYLVLFPSRAVVYRESSNKIINIAPIINTNNIEQ